MLEEFVVDSGADESAIRKYLDRLLLIHCQSSAQFLVTLHSLESLVATRYSNTRLIVLDSVDGFHELDKFAKTQPYFSSSVRTLAHFIRTRHLAVIATRSCHNDKQIRRSMKRDSAGEGKFNLQAPVNTDDAGYFTEWQQLITGRRLFIKHAAIHGIFTVVNVLDSGKVDFTITGTGLSFAK